MKFLILVSIITWSFGQPLPWNVTKQVVSSPQEAAIIIWRDRPSSFDVEPDRKEYHLYEVDLETKTIKEINIPKLKFE